MLLCMLRVVVCVDATFVVIRVGVHGSVRYVAHDRSDNVFVGVHYIVCVVIFVIVVRIAIDSCITEVSVSYVCCVTVVSVDVVVHVVTLLCCD